MHEVLQATATVLSLVNPVVCAAMFNNATSGQDRSARLAAASQAILAIAVILITAALFGTKLLALFGISLDAFAVAGGGILIWIGIGMFNPEAGKTSASAESSRALGPLIMFAASPGTITGVITVAAHHSGTQLPVSALLAIAIALFITWIVIISLSKLGGSERPSFWRVLATRYMGLIVIAMGVQFALSGWKAFGKV
jgi:multiple antibiotic resistance protein